MLLETLEAYTALRYVCGVLRFFRVELLLRER